MNILKVFDLALIGVGAAIAGLMYAGRVASANPAQGSGLILNAIAAIFSNDHVFSRRGWGRVYSSCYPDFGCFR